VRLDIGYDGSGFAGWAAQPGQRTVQDELQHALATILRLPTSPQVTVAGRTDAGVHARGQVCHVDMPSAAWMALGQGSPVSNLSNRGTPDPNRPALTGSGRRSGDVLVRRLAGVLPADIRVFVVTEAPAGFDARFSAISRRYAYRVADTPYGVDPLRRHDVLWHPRPLDLNAMNAAAARLLGDHDFAAFCKPRAGATTVRTLRSLDWTRAERELAVANVEADAFCHTMVRSLVGALLAVGDGRRPVDWPAEVLARRQRDSAVVVVAPHGLTLEEVRYPPDHLLAVRTKQARAARIRTPPRP
jgi:tRNA pseudouridine38-40 synthase